MKKDFVIANAEFKSDEAAIGYISRAKEALEEWAEKWSGG